MIFGVHAGLRSTSADEIRALWTRIEQLRFEWISVWDHFYAADVTDREPGYECLEGLTAYAAHPSACASSRSSLRGIRALFTEEVVDRIGEYAEAGADQINVAMRAPFDVAGLERFATEVLPQFTRAVGA